MADPDATSLRELNELFRQTLGGLRHELGNHAFALSLLQEVLGDQLTPASQREFQTTGDRLKALMDALGGMRTAIVPDVELVVSDLAGAGGIDWRLAGDVERTLCCDPPALGAALDELVRNSQRHHPASPTTIDVLRDEQDLVFALVTPLSTPLAVDVARDPAAPFVSGDGRVGLGLTIVRRVALAHGGRIEFDADESSFRARLRLPAPLE